VAACQADTYPDWSSKERNTKKVEHESTCLAEYCFCLNSRRNVTAHVCDVFHFAINFDKWPKGLAPTKNSFRWPCHWYLNHSDVPVPYSLFPYLFSAILILKDGSSTSAWHVWFNFPGVVAPFIFFWILDCTPLSSSPYNFLIYTPHLGIISLYLHNFFSWIHFNYLSACLQRLLALCYMSSGLFFDSMSTPPAYLIKPYPLLLKCLSSVVIYLFLYTLLSVEIVLQFFSPPPDSTSPLSFTCLDFCSFLGIISIADSAIIFSCTSSNFLFCQTIVLLNRPDIFCTRRARCKIAPPPMAVKLQQSALAPWILTVGWFAKAGYLSLLSCSAIFAESI